MQLLLTTVLVDTFSGKYGPAGITIIIYSLSNPGVSFMFSAELESGFHSSGGN